MDRTIDLESWNESIKLQNLSYIADSCNQFIVPNVLSPWGWSDFIHKVGYVDMDAVIQRFIQKCNLFIVDVSRLSKMEQTCNDYFR